MEAASLSADSSVPPSEGVKGTTSLSGQSNQPQHISTDDVWGWLERAQEFWPEKPRHLNEWDKK